MAPDSPYYLAVLKKTTKIEHRLVQMPASGQE